MNFHEYQAKELVERFEVAVPAGEVVDSLEQVEEAAKKVGGGEFVHCGAGEAALGRGPRPAPGGSSHT